MDFANRISITCFAASYAIGLLHELLRIGWPTRFVRWMATTATLAGLFAQTLFLAARTATQHRLPIATQFDSLIVVSWLVSLIHLYLLIRDRRLGTGLFLLPINIALLIFAGMLRDRSPHDGDSNGGVAILATAHGIMLLAATVAIVCATLAASMYLVKLRQLKTSTWSNLRLPSLERLDRLNSLGVYLAWPLLTFGLGIGFVIRLFALSDPKVVTALFAWVLVTALANYRFRPEHHGRRVAWLTIVAGAMMLLSVLGDPIFGTTHQTDGANKGLRDNSNAAGESS